VAITVVERADSRPAAAGDAPAATLKYTIKGTDDEQAALAALAGAAPAAYNGLVRQTWKVEPVGDGSDRWDGEVQYGRMSGAAKQVGDSTYTLEIGGGTEHITVGQVHIQTYIPPGGSFPDFFGAIGVTHDAVEGCDIDVPVYRWSETHYKAAAFVTGDYKAGLFAIACNPINDAAFRGFAAGTVRFLGVTGSQRGDESWELTYQFAAMPNTTGRTIGTITGIEKKGWEYLWVRYEDVKDDTAKILVKKPVAVCIEQVYGYSDFAGLGIGT
jgi:hypothetical protein